MSAAARERVLRFVVSNPGATSAEIHRAVGVGEPMNTYNAAHALCDGGHIIYRQEGKRKRWYLRAHADRARLDSIKRIAENTL